MLGTVWELTKSVGYLFLWAVIPGLILRMIMGCITKDEENPDPNSEKYKKSKGNVVMWLSMAYFGYKMWSTYTNQEQNYYDYLGISYPITRPALIKRAYRNLSLKHHPDKGGSQEEFNKIREAYEVLGSIDSRRIYDRLGKTVFDCKDCVGMMEYWLSMRMLDTCMNYFIAVVFLVWACWGHTRAWIRPYMWLILFGTMICELVFVFSDEAPVFTGHPNFEVVDMVRQGFYIGLSSACIMCNYWPGDSRTDREIIKNLELRVLECQQNIQQLLVMNQCVMEDPQLRKKLTGAYERRAQSLSKLLSSPQAAAEFARQSVQSFTESGNGPNLLVEPKDQDIAPMDDNTQNEGEPAGSPAKDKKGPASRNKTKNLKLRNRKK